jgi:fatty-acid desaturase
LFGYFYALPIAYIILGMGYVTVIAHLPSLQKFGTRPFTTTDNSWNSKLFAILLAGEGYHNTHHAFPGRSNYETQPGDIDLSGRIIELLK